MRAIFVTPATASDVDPATIERTFYLQVFPKILITECCRTNVERMQCYALSVVIVNGVAVVLQ